MKKNIYAFFALLMFMFIIGCDLNVEVEPIKVEIDIASILTAGGTIHIFTPNCTVGIEHLDDFEVVLYSNCD